MTKYIGLNVPVHAMILSQEDPINHEKRIDAILELVDTRRQTMTKLLTVTLSPEFLDWEDESKLRERVKNVYARVLTHMITLGNERAHSTGHTIKIYGRNNSLKAILEEVVKNQSMIKSDSSHSEAKMEGRFLNVTFSPKQ
ncbi:hypothetical protein CPHO_06715 [Corynebacterium phocae]|uniref:Uncharacterized protein n=1 Tax=Corynebacterium phocae TaxID=161895 RepID=A0A1L7D3F8_9CORY|nr:hypothetical protein [Corynebacterium phocae]APT92635.1 hypothetical protein CPHO_06715 [Corynebacterium phocae]KAA8723882.1 hypothetical protein F4V58_06245 [Corynebacterium phocae]